MEEEIDSGYGKDWEKEEFGGGMAGGEGKLEERQKSQRRTRDGEEC